MKENPPFQQGSRGCLMSLVIIVLTISAMSISTNFHFPENVSCGGMLGAGFPILFICDDWGGGSPTSSWGKLDFVDVVNGGIRPAGFFIDFFFYVLLILILWQLGASLYRRRINHHDLWWTIFILLGFIFGSIFAYLVLWSSDSHIKEPPIGTATPVLPTATASETMIATTMPGTTVAP